MASASWPWSRRNAAARRRSRASSAWFGGAESIAQQVREEVVIAKSLAAAVRGHQEQGATGQQVEHLLGVGLSGDRIADIGAQPLQDRRVEEEAAHVGVEVIDDLLGEVVGDEPVAPGESFDERVDVGESLQRDRRQLQARGPAVCASDQCVGLGGREGTTGNGFEQISAFVRVEGQVDGSDLDQPGLESQRSAPQRRVPPGAQDEPGAVRESLDEAIEVPPDGPVGEQVHVVEHDHQAALDLLQADEELAHQRRTQVRPRGPGRVSDPLVEVGGNGGDRRRQCPNEDDGIVMDGRDLQVAGRRGRSPHPLSQQDGLP